MNPAFFNRLRAARPEVAASHLRNEVKAAHYSDGTPCTVSVPLLNLSLSPDRDAGLATQLLFGEGFTVYETRRDGFSWGQSNDDGYVGYVATSGLGQKKTTTHRITSLHSHVYSEPDLKSPAICTLPFLAHLDILPGEGDFRQLGSGGYVPRAHIAPVTGDHVDQARRFIGTPYLWGGRSACGIDCSGLVQLALMAAGRETLRDSDMQEQTSGTAVDIDSPWCRGDLVFWRGHVGILTDTDRLLHATATGMAVAEEPYAEAVQRIYSAGDGKVTGRRRPV